MENLDLSGILNYKQCVTRCASLDNTREVKIVVAYPSDSLLALSISDNDSAIPEQSSWVGPLIALGNCTSRLMSNLDNSQLIIAISVPSRDFASLLIGCGWIMASPEPKLASPFEVLSTLQQNTPVRYVTETAVIVDHFKHITVTKDPPRAHFKRTQWEIPRINAVIPLQNSQDVTRMSRPSPGSLSKLFQIEQNWDARLALPSRDLAIVGTSKWLLEDMDAQVGAGVRFSGKIANDPMVDFQGLDGQGD